MKNFSFLLQISLLSFSLFSLSSCISTDEQEPESKMTRTKLVLNLSAPEDAATRADAGYKLRYVAKIYVGTGSSLSASISDRKEIIEGDKGNEGGVNQIVFDVPVDNSYVVQVFADYIPQEYEATDWRYKDYFYDTSSNQDGVTILTTPGNKNTDDIDPSFFNNDNYDCFAAFTEIERKTAERIILDMVLTRAVAKVRFVDTSKLNGTQEIKGSVLNYNSSYVFSSGSGGGWRPRQTNFTINSGKDFEGTDEQEVFFFYTFASTNTNFYKAGLTFSINNGSNTKNIEVPEIPLQKNYITTVKGNFLPDIMEEIPMTPEEPSTAGPIYVNMTTDSTPWNNQTSTFN